MARALLFREVMPTRVLVADDDPDMRLAVAHSLAADGMSVDQARSGGEALTKLAEGTTDILVTDVMMPELGGVQVAAMARTAGEQIPILVITGRDDAWISDSVRKLQCADLLHKPFSDDELLERVHRLLAQREMAPATPPPDSEPHVFPPALVPALRRTAGSTEPLRGVPDEDLVELVSTIFFAGLENEEGERHPLRVVFVGESSIDAEPPVAGVPSALYRWSTLRFEKPRAFGVTVLVKLAAAITNGREYVQVARCDGRLVVTGLAREGVNLEGDAALKLVVERPGGLSIRMGRHHLLDYEHGRVQSLATSSVIFSGGPVRRALEDASESAGLPTSGAGRYLDVVRRLVAKLSAHGRGGILVFDIGGAGAPPGESGFRTHPDIALAAILLRIHRLSPHAGPDVEPTQLLAGALQNEIQHSIVEIGALTALDGATILDASLALLGFGLVLPVGDPTVPIVEAENVEATRVRPFDLGGRGTRHRAAASWAFAHPRSVVFVASQDGELGCLFRARGEPAVTLWRFRAADLQRQ